MRNRWDVGSIELHYFDDLEENKKHTLDELTDILYSYFCQLELASNQAKATCAVSNPAKEET